MNATNAQIRRLITAWAERLCLDPKWEFAVRVVREEAEADPDYLDSDAYVLVHEGYYTAEITIHLFAIQDRAALEEAVCHELVHVVLAPLSTLARTAGGRRLDGVAVNAIEAATTQLSRAMVGMRRR